MLSIKQILCGALATFVFFFWVSSGVAAPHQPLELSPGFGRLQPAESLAVYRDKTAALGIQGIMQLAPEAFQDTGYRAANFGLDNMGALWIKSTIQSPVSRELLAEVAFPTLRDVSLFAVVQGAITEEFHTGLNRPFSTRPVDASSFIFPLQLEANQPTDIYLRIATDGPLVAPLIFWEDKPLSKSILHSHSVMAMYFGLVIALSIYNLILFFNIRDNAYLFYTVHLFFICWFQASMNGYTAMYLWADVDSSLPSLEPPIAASLSIAIVFQFTQRFLRVEKISRALNRALNIGTLASLSLIALVFIAPLKTAVLAMFAGFAACVATLVFTGIYAFRKGIRSARYFLLGWGIMMTGAIIQNQMYQGILPFSFFTMQAVLFASAIEAILMSLALADRINLMRKQKSLAHRQALESAEQSNQLKDQFLATISHELLTPMNGVLGALELVDFASLKSEDKQAIEVARLSSRRMLTLINGLLNYTEAQMESSHVNKRAFRLPADVSDLLDHLQQCCASRHLKSEIINRIPAGEEFYGDVEKLRTILLHLTENALKFTNDGHVAVEFSVANSGNHRDQTCILTLVVRDTGVGIDKAKQQEIFDAFRQLDADYNRKQGGLGIGLALVKRLVTVMGGELILESQAKQGTCITVQLPVNRFADLRQENEPCNLTYIHQHQEPFVLIAEDNEVNQKILAALCSKLGYRSIVAINGEAAVTIAKQVSPALIFMDCQMPIMDGFEATRRIRLLNKAMHQVPIIAVTANASSKDQQHCFEAGMNDHITKPISLNNIQSCLMRWLPTQQHQPALLERAKSRAE